MKEIKPVDELKVLEAMKPLKSLIDNLGFNQHEKILLLKNCLAHEENTLERKNLCAVMMSSLNKFK